MKRLILAAALILISAGAMHAGCPLHGAHAGPHFFAGHGCRGACHLKIQDKLYRMGLTRMPGAGDMHAHTPYETRQIYYYDRPYQARHVSGDITFSGGTIHSALMQYYETRENELKDDSRRFDVLEYAEGTLP